MAAGASGCLLGTSGSGLARLGSAGRRRGQGILSQEFYLRCANLSALDSQVDWVFFMSLG